MDPRPSASVAVVVVNWNGADVLPRCLDALSRQTVRPAQIIVVDNASTDGSADIAEREPGVDLVRLDQNVGFAAANNRAVELAENCEWVALLNPDAFPEPGWLEALLRAAEEQPMFTFFASRLLQADEPETLDGTGDALHVSGLAWRRGHGAPAAGTALEREEVFSACAAAAMYRRDAYRRYGGLDERFFCYFEDTDLAFRLRLAGHRCLYVPDAVVHHVGSAVSGATSDFTVRHSYRNLVWTWVRNMPTGLALLYLPHFLLANLLLLGAFTLRGRPHVILGAQVAALRGIRSVWRDRGVVQEWRVVSAWDLRRVLSRGLGGYVTSFVRWRRRRSGPLREAEAHE